MHRTYSYNFLKSKTETQTPHGLTARGALKNRCVGLREEALPDVTSRLARRAAEEYV